MMKKYLDLYPWLNQLPKTILSQLNFEEFFIDHSLLNFDLSTFEQKLDSNIMIYKNHNLVPHDNNKYQLCKLAKIKTLPPKLLDEIIKLEQEVSNKILIITYKRPLELKI